MISLTHWQLAQILVRLLHDSHWSWKEFLLLIKNPEIVERKNILCFLLYSSFSNCKTRTLSTSWKIANTLIYNFGRNIKQSIKVKQNWTRPENFLHLLLRNCWALVPKAHFWKRDWGLGCVPNRLWDFP